MRMYLATFVSKVAVVVFQLRETRNGLLDQIYFVIGLHFGGH